MSPESCRRFRLLIPLAVLAFVALLSLLVYALWNGVVADVLGVKAITYWQALGLLVLSKILFGGFPVGGRRCRSRVREHMLSKHWESLDPEQREHMRDEMRRRFGNWPCPPCDGPERPDPEGRGKTPNS